MPADMSKQYFTDRMVQVTPIEGGYCDEPYQTYLLSTWLTDLGRVYCVSGPTILMPETAVVTEVDGSPLQLQYDHLHPSPDCRYLGNDMWDCGVDDQ